MRVFLAGGTGAIGRPLLGLLLQEGHEVIALARSPRRALELEALGAQAAVADALDGRRVREAVIEAAPDAVINQLTQIPRRLNPRRISDGMAATNRLRVEATQSLVEAACAAGSRLFVNQSISFLYDPTGDGLASEDDPLHGDAPAAYRELVRAVDLSERAVLRGGGPDGIVLRYGYFYGPGTIYAPDGSFAEDVRRRRVPVVGNGEGVCSFVHVEDAAAATVSALEHRQPGAYNIVDDDPAPVRAWLPEYARLLGAPPPRTMPRFVGRLGAGSYGLYYMTRQRGASNEKATTMLGWRPRYASWRDGFPAELLGDRLP